MPAASIAPRTLDAARLQRKAHELRLDILEMVLRAKGGHIGGAYSIIDVMTALYLRALRHDPANPAWEGRDRVVYSKGHGCLALYNVLAEAGYFDRRMLERFCTDGGVFAGHPERGTAPGIEVTAGSLGHGLSQAVGMALAARMDRSSHRVFAVLSDGECNEGSTWEAIMSAGHFRLEPLVLIVDSNKLESLGKVSDIMNIEPLAEKLRSFGWAVREIDGHDMTQIVAALEGLPFEPDKPSAIVAHTVKGKGVSFMEGVPVWHYRCPNEQEAALAREELRRLLA